MRRVAVWLATGLGIGFLPLAPATAASFAVALFLLPLHGRIDPLVLAAAIVALLPLGVWTSAVAERSLGPDARPIVIDEVIGMLVGVWGIPLGSRPALALLAAFLLFRFFDIVKPPPIRQSQRLPGGWGVVADDVLAGIATNVGLRVAIGWVSP